MAKEFGLKLGVLLDKYKKEDGSYDIDKAQEDLQGQVNGFTASLKPDLEALKEEVKPEVESNFIKSLKLDGVENRDGFTAYVKRLGSSSTELTEKIGRLEAEGLKTKEAFDTLTKNHTIASKKILGFERAGAVIGNGFNAKYSKAVTSEAESRMTEDVNFEEALKLVKTDYPEWLTKQSAGGKTPPGKRLTEDEETANMRKTIGL